MRGRISWLWIEIEFLDALTRDEGLSGREGVVETLKDCGTLVLPLGGRGGGRGGGSVEGDGPELV